MKWHGLLMFFALLIGFPTLAGSKSDSNISIPEMKYTVHTLPNGLTVIVVPDHKSPLVACHVWYHVGSSLEPAGKTGYAHLFEHLMFQGSEHRSGNFNDFLKQLGGTRSNGSTWHDWTNYYATIPKEAWKTLLWAEADRMGFTLSALSQNRLNNQRGVVINEKREKENKPYGTRVLWNIHEALWGPSNHPYTHLTIGSEEDLQKASLADLKTWFKTYYGPNNAVIVVVGDVDSEEVYSEVTKWFGDIPSGPAIQRLQIRVPVHATQRRGMLEDATASKPRLYVYWTVPGYGTADNDYLTLVGDLLAGGNGSRLYKRLVLTGMATSVEQVLWPWELASEFGLKITLQNQTALPETERIIHEEIDDLVQHGPGKEELTRVVTKRTVEVMRAMENYDEMGGLLAEGFTYTGNPDSYRESLRCMQSATPKLLRSSVKTWLGVNNRPYLLTVVPVPQRQISDTHPNRNTPPVSQKTTAAAFPKIEERHLQNGMRVLLVNRNTIPMVSMSVLVQGAGYAADGSLPGLSGMTADLLDEGAGSLTNLQISDGIERLGGQLNIFSDTELTNVSVSVPSVHLPNALDILSDVLLRPTFSQTDVVRIRQARLSKRSLELASPWGVVKDVLPMIFYPDQHPYHTPLHGFGTTALSTISHEHVLEFYRTQYRPDQTTVVVVGDVTLDKLSNLLEDRFGKWKKPLSTKVSVGQEKMQIPNLEPAIYLVDLPGSTQAMITTAQVSIQDRNQGNFLPRFVASHIIGGSWQGRLYKNIREEKGWSYGVFYYLLGAANTPPLITYAPVQADKTADAMKEIRRELIDINGSRPPTDKELSLAQAELVDTLSGRWSTSDNILADLTQIVRYGFPLDYWNQYPKRIQELTKSEISKAAQESIRPTNTIYLVVGDLRQIETQIRTLNNDEFGPIRILESNK